MNLDNQALLRQRITDMTSVDILSDYSTQVCFISKVFAVSKWDRITLSV